MSESGRVAWITRDPHGRAVGIHAARPDAPAELTVEAHEWDTAFDIVRGEWLGEKADEPEPDDGFLPSGEAGA